MSRNVNIRKMDGVKGWERTMLYPYSCIGDEWMAYRIEDIRRPILVEEKEADAGNFPTNIQEHFWIRPGENDGDDWLSCGVLNNGAYFFYTGGCDYTGFDCQGGMSLWVSNSWQNIVEHAMSEGEYELYLQQTEEPLKKEEVTCGYCEKDPATMPNSMTEDGRLCADCFWEITRNGAKNQVTY